MKCGLLGEKLGHSYSPQIHGHLGEYSYSLFEKSPEELEDFLVHEEFIGLNVTIPYKQRVIPFCAELSPIAEKLGAVNILIRRTDGTLYGHNSDHFGFVTLLQKSGLNVCGKKVLVLGSGGAACTAISVLEAEGANVVMISRNGANNYQNLSLHCDASVIVNATPVGMYPNTEGSPLSLDNFPQLEGVLDVIYNPARTKLLMSAERRDIIAMNGLWMLVAQAAEASELFSGKQIPSEKMDEIYALLQKQMQNIVLIGMPGSGKTTVGKRLAELTGKEFIDTDEIIVKRAGCTISEIFEKQGEGAFRELESQVLSEYGKKSGMIIATGGGCVTRKENYDHLHQNGTIFWLHRPLELLPTQGRPLSQTTTLNELYQRRKTMYEAFADEQIDNGKTPEDAAKAILRIWEE